MRVTPLPDYLRGGVYKPAQIAGDAGAFRPSPLKPAPAGATPLFGALAASLVLWMLIKRRR